MQHPSTQALASAPAPPAWLRSPAAPGPAHRPAADFEAVLDEIDHGVVVCDGGGAIEFANFAARSELAQATALVAEGMQLRALGAASHGGLSKALRQAACGGRRQLLALGGPGARLFVTVCPLAGERAEHGGPARVLVRLSRRSLAADLAIELVASSFALTHAERRVLAALVAGGRPGDVAHRHGVKLSTVRTQVQSLRAKLGAADIGELTRIVAAIAVPTPALRHLVCH